MLKIKLARFGKKHQPHYRIVINEARDKRDGRYVAKVGLYAPTQSPKSLVVDLEAYDGWIKKGAQPTETVASLVSRFRDGKPFVKKNKVSQKAKAKAAKSAETPAADVVEAPTAEAAPEAPVEQTAETATEAQTA